jgi:transposase InsO family protein
MLIGYARVSKSEGQDTSAQVSALKKAGAKRIFEDKASGARWDRPELQRLLDHLRPGDVLVVWKLDRLSRSLRDLIHIMEQALHARQPADNLIHHSDRGSQYVSIRNTERLAEAGIDPSVGSVGDSYDCAPPRA